MKTKSICRRLLAAVLCISMLLGLTGCGQTQSTNLMKGVSPGAVADRTADDAFRAASADFAVRLFQQTRKEGQNNLISPLSVMLALAMTANGAQGETRTQMAQVLGGSIPLETLNEYLRTYLQNLPNGKEYKLDIANAIWFRDHELTVEKSFLQTNADYYNAAAYQSPFNDQTCRDINEWVKKNTDGQINQILDRVDPNDIMYLVNAVLFDAPWSTQYKKSAIHDAEFINADGERQTVSMMYSDEAQYLGDGQATGFIKPYRGGYRFVALMPNEGVSLDQYVASLTGAELLRIIQSAQNVTVHAGLPQFADDDQASLNDALCALGMSQPFDSTSADFSALGRTSSGEPIFIGEVLHKTHIEVDANGTKAAAVTVVGMEKGYSMPESHTVILDRPFVYAIVDGATNLPIFIGTMAKIAE